jgi:hypothetical protein
VSLRVLVRVSVSASLSFLFALSSSPTPAPSPFYQDLCKITFFLIKTGDSLRHFWTLSRQTKTKRDTKCRLLGFSLPTLSYRLCVECTREATARLKQSIRDDNYCPFLYSPPPRFIAIVQTRDQAREGTEYTLYTNRGGGDDDEIRGKGERREGGISLGVFLLQQLVKVLLRCVAFSVYGRAL